MFFNILRKVSPHVIYSPVCSDDSNRVSVDVEEVTCSCSMSARDISLGEDVLWKRKKVKERVREE